MSELHATETRPDTTAAELATDSEVRHRGDLIREPDEPVEPEQSEEPEEPEEPEDPEEQQDGAESRDEVDVLDGADAVERAEDSAEEAEPLEPVEPAESAESGDPFDVTDSADSAPEAISPREFSSNEEGAEYGRETWKEAYEQLTPEQYEALRGYSDEKGPEDLGPPDYKEINGALRGYADSTAEVEESIARIDEAMELRPIPESVMVLRETGPEAFDRPVSKLEGSTQTDPAFFSTALGSDATFNSEKDIVLHLEVPEGTPAMYMEQLAHYPERELLLGRGLEYEVSQVDPPGDDGRWHVYGAILPTSKEQGEQ
ncbi:ADP-ribosyltransferase [Streptomyces sp. NPDC013978]|uniref:ADP-ribosyltransferase n=1 Tax=Streptomyces sp. NPDC013978 TaxID=3364869 RepID=UPI003702F477